MLLHFSPMRLGLMSDIHGNRIALDAVIADGENKGVGTWWVLGDLVAIGAEPEATLERLGNLPNVSFVRGNTDRYVVTGERPSPHREEVERDESLRALFNAVESSFAWTHAHMAAARQLDFLKQLPTRQQATLDDGTTLLGIHASPRSDDGPGITPDIADDRLDRLLGDPEADIICGGHTHQATDRRLGKRRAINLGSVSNPMTSDLRATYVVVDSDRHGHRLRHHRVAYDHARVIERLRRSDHPEAEYISSFQRGEQARYPATRPGAPNFDS